MSYHNTPRAALRAAGLSQTKSAWARITYNKLLTALEDRNSLMYAGNLVTYDGSRYTVTLGVSGWPPFMHDVVREHPKVLDELTPELISAVKDRLCPQPPSARADRLVQIWVQQVAHRTWDLSEAQARVTVTFLAHALGSVLTGEWS